MLRQAVPILLLAAVFPAGAASGYERLPRALADLSPVDFAEKIRIVDDPAQRAVVLSTEDGYARGRRIEGGHANDVHLRALVDRGTGKVRWQVWHELVTVDGRRGDLSVEFTAGGKRRSVRPTAVERWLDECPLSDAPGRCNHFTLIGFELSERTVREIAAGQDGQSRRPWQVRFRDSAGKVVTGGIAPAEAAGLLQALADWRLASGRRAG